MVVWTDSVVFKLLELYRRANNCQETCQGKLFVCTGLNIHVLLLLAKPWTN